MPPIIDAAIRFMKSAPVQRYQRIGTRPRMVVVTVMKWALGNTIQKRLIIDPGIQGRVKLVEEKTLETMAARGKKVIDNRMPERVPDADKSTLPDTGVSPH
jgi:hypothetical protein